MPKAIYRSVATNEEAIALGFPNVQSYRLAVRQEQEREGRLAYAEAVAWHQAALAAQLQSQGPLHNYRTSPLTPQQQEHARRMAAEQGEGR